jgi:inorganic pyrophosphatase
MSKKAINATHYELIPTLPNDSKSSDVIVHAIIETSKNSPHKYALKTGYGIIAFSEVLPAGMHWPDDYGFVPQTLADDGDPLDILVLTDDALFSGCLIETRVIGSVRLSKNGVENDRLIAVPLPSEGAPKPTDSYNEIGDLPQALLNEIVDFLGSEQDVSDAARGPARLSAGRSSAEAQPKRVRCSGRSLQEVRAVLALNRAMRMA